MTSFVKGDFVRILCEAQETPFPNEMMITLATREGEMDGLVQDCDLKKFGEKWHVRGLVDSVEEDSLIAWVWGEFLRTGGLVKMPLNSVREWFD